MKQDLLRLPVFVVLAMGVQSISSIALAQSPLPIPLPRRGPAPSPPTREPVPPRIDAPTSTPPRNIQPQDAAAPSQIAALPNKCFSKVCIGDDIAKLSSLNISWLREEYPDAKKLENGVMLRPTGRTPGTALLQAVAAAYRGLSEAERKTLALTLTGSYAQSREEEYKLLIPSGRFSYLVLGSDVLKILNTRVSAICAMLPIYGAFKSESGHNTSVLLMPENGKLTVARIVRQWVFNAPTDISEHQQMQVLDAQLKDLSKQIVETYGTAVYPEIGTVQIQRHLPPIPDERVVRANLGFYSEAYYKWSAWEARWGWPAEPPPIDKELSSAPGCDVKPVSVTIN